MYIGTKYKGSGGLKHRWWWAAREPTALVFHQPEQQVDLRCHDDGWCQYAVTQVKQTDW